MTGRTPLKDELLLSFCDIILPTSATHRVPVREECDVKLTVEHPKHCLTLTFDK
jgi:hypothetical protein